MAYEPRRYTNWKYKSDIHIILDKVEAASENECKNQIDDRFYDINKSAETRNWTN